MSRVRGGTGDQLRIGIAGNLIEVDCDADMGFARTAFARIGCANQDASGATRLSLLASDGPLFEGDDADESRFPRGDAAAVLLHERTSYGLRLGANRSANGGSVLVHGDWVGVEVWMPGDDVARGGDRLGLVLAPHDEPPGDIAAQPAQAALASWGSRRGLLATHAAAIAANDRGIVLIGPGGRGKTTTALACALRGMEYLGDDYCFISAPRATSRRASDDHSVIHAVYATAKVSAATVDLLGLSDWTRLGMTPRNKSAVAVPDRLSFRSSVPLTVIVAVEVSSAPTYQLERVSSAKAIPLLAAASAPALRVEPIDVAWWSHVTRIARSTPVFRMTVNEDLDRVVDVLGDLVHRGVARTAGVPRRS